MRRWDGLSGTLSGNETGGSPSRPNVPTPTPLPTSAADFAPTRIGNPICTTTLSRHLFHTGGPISLHNLSVAPGWTSTLLVLVLPPRRCFSRQMLTHLPLPFRLLTMFTLPRCPAFLQLRNFLWILPFAARATTILIGVRIRALEGTLMTA